MLAEGAALAKELSAFSARARSAWPGVRVEHVDVAGVGVGLTTCYDIRFPELHTELAQRGARVLTVHASWASGPHKLDQWTLLAQARALDTTSVVAAVDQAYPGDELAKVGPTGVGGSLVSSPTGEVIAQAGADPELLIVDVDLDSVDQARRSIAVLSNRTEFGRKAESAG